MLTYEALVLGVAQDGGVPHMGCSCSNCSAALTSQDAQQLAVSMALIQRCDEPSQPQPTARVWLLDCGPDIKQQWRLLASHLRSARIGSWSLEGVFLTHLHMGHYLGLHQFGREAMKADSLKIYCTASVQAWLAVNQPWKANLDDGIFRVVSIDPGQPLQLAPGLSVTPLLVPHRHEHSDTVAFSVTGPGGPEAGGASKRILWCPDIDSWQAWDSPLRQVVEQHDTSFLDACFWSPEELQRRDMGEIPHPLVTDTLQRLEGLGARVQLIHLNHTNPLWDPASAASQTLKQRGFQVGRQGSVFPL